jgi:phospholipid/cholesterol/gamma-HCH transport system substrate-binding protein
VSKEIKIGLVVTSAIFMLYWGANYLNGNDVFSQDNSIYARYKNLDGLTSSSGVNYKGMQVGTVRGVKFNPGDIGGYCWIVKFDVTTEGITLMDSCRAEIASADLLGTMVIDLSHIKEGVDSLHPGDTIIGVLSKSLQDKVDERLRPLQNKINQLVESADTLINTFVTVLDDKTQNNIKRSFEQIPAAISNILNATKSLDSITTDLKNARVERIVDHIESITKTLDNNKGKLTNIIDNLDNITDSLAQACIKDAICNADKVLALTYDIMEKINSGEGSIGLLLNDKKLYDNIRLASADLDLLLLDLKQNPGRYLNVSLLNFGSKRQKDPRSWDTSEVRVLQDNLYKLNALKTEAISNLAKELTDSCGNQPCDTATVRRIIQKY